MLVIFIPIIVAIFGGPSMILAFLLGALASGFCQAVFMANAGPKIYFDYLELGWMDHEYNDRWFLNFSDNLMEQDINIGENFIQNINIQEDINVKLWISHIIC
jgi:hypothetical protein